MQNKSVSSFKEEPNFFKQISGETFSANYVIQAYEEGRQKGMLEKIKELKANARKQFIENRDYVVNTINSLVIDLITYGIVANRGWIKSTDSDDFDAIIGISQKDYFADDFEQFYIKAHQLEESCTSSGFKLNIRFVNNDKAINEEKLRFDGYRLKYEIEVFQKIIN